MKILNGLERKSALVKWHHPERKENFGIISKEVKGKESLREKGYQIFDLGDLDAAFRM